MNMPEWLHLLAISVPLQSSGHINIKFSTHALTCLTATYETKSAAAGKVSYGTTEMHSLNLTTMIQTPVIVNLLETATTQKRCINPSMSDLLLDEAVTDPTREFGECWWNAAEAKDVPVRWCAPTIEQVERQCHDASKVTRYSWLTMLWNIVTKYSYLLWLTKCVPA